MRKETRVQEIQEFLLSRGKVIPEDLLDLWYTIAKGDFKNKVEFKEFLMAEFAQYHKEDKK